MSRSSCCKVTAEPAARGVCARKIAIVGNPNVGKSVLFNRLTGGAATVSNYPGTTVEVERGRLRVGAESFEVIDTPGMYSLAPITDEERVARDILFAEKPFLTLHVVDAKNLERMLPLTLELIERGLPSILVLNMMDEAEGLGMSFDLASLERQIGVPVAPTVSTRGRGLPQLLDRIRSWGNIAPAGEEHSAECDKPAQEYLSALRHHDRAAHIVSSAVREGASRINWSDRLDRVLMNPLSGGIILAAVLYFGFFQFVGVFGAGTVVNFMEKSVFGALLNPLLTKFIYSAVPWPVLRDLFVGEYGMITLGVRYAVSLILPIITFFFIAFSVIEDSGYLPRLAMLLDGIFKRIGLSGRAVIPTVLGFGCVTMATLVTRTLATRRERTIATLLLALAIPCSAQLGVIFALLSAHPTALVWWGTTILVVFLGVGTVLARLLPGEKPSFYMELPPLRWPAAVNVLSKTFVRVKWYLIEVMPLFLWASFFIWLGRLTGVFDALVKLLARPLYYLGLPAESAPAFLFGFFRRDYGAAGLYDLAKQGKLDTTQVTVACVALTLFLPCIAQFLINLKERGWKTGLAISAFTLVFSFSTAFVLYRLILWTGVAL